MNKNRKIETKTIRMNVIETQEKRSQGTNSNRTVTQIFLKGSKRFLKKIL
jgi:hypothetical protein